MNTAQILEGERDAGGNEFGVKAEGPFDGETEERLASSWMLRRVAIVRIDVSEEFSASIFRVRIGELGT
jgi:hypothetical protein